MEVITPEVYEGIVSKPNVFQDPKRTLHFAHTKNISSIAQLLSSPFSDAGFASLA
jgi:hypothetical protein